MLVSTMYIIIIIEKKVKTLLERHQVCTSFFETKIFEGGTN